MVGPQLDQEDLEQLDEFDLEEMDLKWQVAMISIRMKKFYKNTGKKLQFDAKEPVDFDKTKEERCWNSGNKGWKKIFGKLETLSISDIDGEGEIWTSHSEVRRRNLCFDDLQQHRLRHRGDSEKEDESAQDYFVMPIWSSYSSTVKRSTTKDAGEAPNKHPDIKTDEKPLKLSGRSLLKKLRICFYKQELLKASSTNIFVCQSFLDGTSFSDPTNSDQDDSEIPALEDIYKNPTDGIFTNSSYDDEGCICSGFDFTHHLETVVNVSPIPTSRINSIHPSTLILGDPQSVVQTRSKVTKSSGAHAFEKGNWNKIGFIEIRRMREELWIEAIRIFLAFASYMRFIVFKMDVKSAFLYGKIDEEVYVSQPPGFYRFLNILRQVLQRRGKALYGLNQSYPEPKDKNDIMLVQVYVDDIIFGSTKRSWCDEFEALMKSKFQMSSMGELTFFLGLQVKQKEDGIFISQDKYVAEILKKFDFVSVKTASTPIETQKPLVKDEEASDVDVHLYRSMIGSLMYLTASRPDIMFAVCACSRFQVTPKTSHLNAVKRIFRYLKGKPKLGLWYPRVSSFDLEAYSDSDYAGANLDRKSTTGGCQFLGRRLISWQCKKQTIVATSTTEAEYVAAANCCGQVLWIQNQMLDYGFNFMNTKIYIDNESTICIVKNPVFHSKTKHIAIRHHFIRDAYEKKLIQVLKIHTDDNVADLLTKAFDVSRFQFLVVTIGMINP
ncbi:putative ribonuclease H-like domain-containing protein [Tanacetum coccineum]